MDKKPGRVFVTDCEGPITKNDNAAELAEAFIPNGAAFFRKLSLYDDYLAEIDRRKDYKAGDTLKLILPFFKAYGLDNRSMEKFSRRNIEIIPLADIVLKQLSIELPCYIVSTSYSQYISAVCSAIGFPFAKTFSTVVSLDDFEVNDSERQRLKEIHSHILDLPEFHLPERSFNSAKISDEDLNVIKEFDRLFWEVLPEMKIYDLARSTNPIGGDEKALAVIKIAEHEGVNLSEIIYFGDSITDIQAFRMIKEAGGIAVSFNGNDWAVGEAGFEVTSRNALPIGWLTNMFLKEGHSAFIDLTMGEMKPELIEEVAKLSTRVRKTVRSEQIGGLG